MRAPIEFLRVGAPEQEIPAVRDHRETVYSLAAVTADIDGAFLSGGGVEHVRNLLENGALPTIDIRGMRVGPPVARPQAVVCIGQNYAAHARESGGEPPTVPIVFFKHPNTIVGPYDEVAIPRRSRRTDWEVELAIVIGARASYLASAQEGGAHIAGYAVSNDVSERAFQLDESGGQWSKGKSSPGFNPLGPVLVPADQVDADDLRIRSWVNGEPRQDSRTADMIFAPGFLVWHLSQYMTLEPGDVINTGTPEGVALSGRFPYLRSGDAVACEISGLGLQEQRFHAIP